MSKGEIKIMGNGTIHSGEYTNINIMGNATTEGNVVADKIKVMGNATFQGDLEGGECKIYGNATVIGNLSVIRLKVDGDLTLEGDCKVQELIVNGVTTIKGSVEGNNITSKGGLVLNRPLTTKHLKVYGVLTSSSDIRAEEVIVKGGLKCEGLLNAEQITIQVFEKSYCKEIGATTLIVEKPMYHLLWLSYHKKGSLTCETIEADQMSLENVIAKAARGKEVTLSNECQIQVVECSNHFDASKDSIVQEFIKID